MIDLREKVIYVGFELGSKRYCYNKRFNDTITNCIIPHKVFKNGLSKFFERLASTKFTYPPLNTSSHLFCSPRILFPPAVCPKQSHIDNLCLTVEKTIQELKL